MVEKNANGLSDVSKTGLPLPMLITLSAVLVAGLGAFYGMNERQARFETALEYEREKDDLRVELTKEQIENAGLRTSLMMASAEASRCISQPKGR